MTRQRPAAETPRPTWTPGWVFYALLALAVSVWVTWAAPMWFGDTDASWLAWASQHGLADAWGRAGVLAGDWRPLTLSVEWLAFHTFGWTYWPYQLVQLLGWFATLGAYYAMLRALWWAPRLALAAAMLTALVFFWLHYYVFHFAQVGFQLALALGFASVALAASGWRHRSWPRLIAGLGLLALAYLAREAAVVYLPVLHGYAAIALGRPRRQRLRGALVFTAAVVVCSGLYLWFVRGHLEDWPVLRTLTLQGAWQRLSFYAGLLCGGPACWLLTVLAALAGVAQAMRLVGRRWAWMALIGGTLALLTARVHPLVTLLILSVMVRRVWPFALWALLTQAALLLMRPMWPLYLLEPSFAYVPGLLVAIHHSPLGIWARRFVERARGGQRTMVQSAIVIAIAVVLANLEGPVRRHVAALAISSQRRQAMRDLTDLLIERAPAGDRVGLVTDAELGRLPQAVHALTPDKRAIEMVQFGPAQYQQLLTAMGRDDLRVVTVRELRGPGGWLLTTSAVEVHRASVLLGELGPAEQLVQDGLGGLWRIPENSPPAE